MPDFPIDDGARFEHAGVSAANSAGTLVTAGAANTKGAFAQLIASTSFPTSYVIPAFGVTSAGAPYLIDLAIGAAGSEVVILPNMFLTVANGTADAHPSQFSLFPLHIPAGSRVSCRCQSTTANATLRAQVLLIGLGFMPATPLQRATAYGVDAANSRGTSVDPGAAANTKGAFAQIVASTTNPIRQMAVFVGLNDVGGRPSGSWLLDVAVGVAGSEVVVIPDLFFDAHGQINITPGCYCFPVSIPAGTRLAARCQSTQTAVVDRTLSVVIIGFD